MADELPEAVGHGVENGVEHGGVEASGGGDADGAVGGEDATLSDLRESFKTFP